jgi:cellulose synthase/poly-beta-1,6-N-acetylglucosamine synthase-like glycosyltransferase
MIDVFFILTGILYILVVILLFTFGLNFYYLTYLSIRTKKRPQPEMTIIWPKVTVQLPVYNELYVVERLIEAVANLDYPQDLLDIQVLDDSTDETSQLAQRAIESISVRGIHIVHIHRSERTGYKAGALAVGLAQAQGEFLAVFDADFVPSPDFLRKTIPSFQDPHIAFLQTRWSHLNRDYSILTYLQSLIIDAHFMIEQAARSQNGYWFNFNGTAGIWRKSAILDAGGWKADTLTEDLDLSYRVLLKGWRAAYLRDVSVPAELPVTITAYRRQQYRWARGSLEVAQKHLREVLQAPISVRQKLEAVLHLTGYGVHLLLFAVSILYPLVLAISLRYPNLMPLFRFAAFFNLGVFAQTIFFLTAQQQLGRNWWKMLPSILFVSALGAGMMLNTVQAALQMYLKKRVGFERTPKFGIGHKERNWNHKRYQLKLDGIVWFELLFAGFNAWTVFYALKHQNWMIAIYAMTFCAGFLLTSGLSIQQMLSLAFQRHRNATPTKEASNFTRVIPRKTSPIGELPMHGETNSISHSNSNELAWRAIQKTIAYSDIFDYPLTAQEIYRYLVGLAEPFDNIQAILDEQLSRHNVSFQDGYYTLPDREHIISIRECRQKTANGLWPKAVYYGNWISHLPFVRMVAVTGALAMNNVDPGADIDYLIVTEPGRLWLCRALVILLVRWASLKGVALCPNYMLSERALVFSDHSVYTAHELAQMIPLTGLEIYARIHQLNQWTEQFLPNANIPRDRPPLKIPGNRYRFIQSWLERGLRTPLGNWLEHWEMERKISKFRAVQPINRESGFSADWCKGHFNRHGQKTLDSYTTRLEMLSTEGSIQ